MGERDSSTIATALELATSTDDRIERVLEFIRTSNDPQLGVPGLARHAGLSESHFYRLFRRQMRVTPARYLKDIRIRRAEYLLRTTNLSLQDILLQVGVVDRSHFLRNFKKLYGFPPSLYRARLLRAMRPE